MTLPFRSHRQFCEKRFQKKLYWIFQKITDSSLQTAESGICLFNFILSSLHTANPATRQRPINLTANLSAFQLRKWWLEQNYFSFFEKNTSLVGSGCLLWFFCSIFCTYIVSKQRFSRPSTNKLHVKNTFCHSTGKVWYIAFCKIHLSLTSLLARKRQQAILMDSCHTVDSRNPEKIQI